MTIGKQGVAVVVIAAALLFYVLTRPRGTVTLEPLEPLEAGGELEALEKQGPGNLLPASTGIVQTENAGAQHLSNEEVDAILTRGGFYKGGLF